MMHADADRSRSTRRREKGLVGTEELYSHQAGSVLTVEWSMGYQ